MNKKSEYKSSIRSKNLIKKAFLELLQEKETNKITVTDIVKKADINRSTFYAHYPDVRGVVEKINEEAISAMLSILDDFKYENFFSNLAPILLEINRYLEDEMEVCRIMIMSEYADDFFEEGKRVFFEYMKNAESIPLKIRNSPTFEMRMSFFVGGIFHMYKQWFKGELNVSLNDIPIEISKIVNESSDALKLI